MGYTANFSYKPLSGLSKQLKEASSQGAKRCIIVGEEMNQNKVVVKDLGSGSQELVDLEQLLAGLSR